MLHPASLRSALPWIGRLGLAVVMAWSLAGNSPATELTVEQKPNAEAFRSMRYGLFSHVVYRLTIAPDGTKSYKSLDEFASGFDVEAYADQLKSLGVEYLIFTAWHARMYLLGPNEAMERGLPGHTAKRDLVGDLADALHTRGIRLIIYAHPNDGHDLPPEEQARIGFIKRDHKKDPGIMPGYDRFINDVYTEMARRYAKKPALLGYWWDSYHVNGGAIDVARLRASVLKEDPRVIILSNYPNGTLIDFHSAERYYNKVTTDDINGLVTMQGHQSAVFAGVGLNVWWCSRLDERCHYSPESLFKFTVLNACTGAPGGMGFAVSPASDGKTWAGNILPTLQGLKTHIDRIRPTLCGVAPSPHWKVKDYVTNSNATTFGASLGYGATRSLDGTVDYLHVLRPPTGKTLDVMAVKETFVSARLYSNRHPVAMEAQPTTLRLTLGEGDVWDPLDTVIVLERKPSTGK